jgi:alkylated DNA repair dioxygenase AlkB
VRDLAWQPSLLDGGELRLDVSYDRLRRIVLDEHSWVDYCPGWLAGSDRLFEELASSGQWRQRSRKMWDNEVLEPRLTAGWSPNAAEAPAVLAEMCRVLSIRYGVEFDSVWVNLYRDGEDSVAWHGDSNRHKMDQPLVATVSLGARRRFLLRKRGSSRIAHELRPGAGDLVVMGGRCQHDWEHAVPKTAERVGPRMSVTIRHSKAAAPDLTYQEE